MDYFKIDLFGEFSDDGIRTIFVKSCRDLTQFSKHKEIIRKVIDLKNQQAEDFDDNGDMNYYLAYGRIEISKIDPLFLNAFINVDELEEVSNCCGYAITENTDLCSRCGEHCAVEILGEE